MLNRFLTFVLILLFPVALLAGNVYHNGIKVESVGETYVLYSDTLIFSEDSTGNHFTDFMDIGDLNEDDCYILAYASDVDGTEDINIYFEISNDRSTVVSWAVDDLDALATTATADTANLIAGVEKPGYKCARWARIKADGQTGNPASTILTVYIFFRKADVQTGSRGERGWGATMERVQ